MEGNLILRRPYTYVANNDSLAYEIKKHINDNAATAFRNWWNQMSRYGEGRDIQVLNLDGSEKAFVWWHDKWTVLETCFDATTLAANSYQEDEVMVYFPKSQKKMKIFKGMKPMKIIHRFVQEMNGPEDLFDAFRNWHSVLLNQKRIDGELCLSIHPLDYMTMSDNDNGWSSCMRWGNNNRQSNYHGDFRTGTLECMNSPYIVEAYLHNPDHVFKFYDNFTWDSKQWRELFLIQPDILTEIKGYPFQDDNLTNTVLMWLKELAQKNLGWTYDPEEVNVSQDIQINELEALYINFNSTQYMYKDFGSLENHRGRINLRKLLDERAVKQPNEFKGKHILYLADVEYGGTATCMKCGKVLDTVDASSVVFCDECDNAPRCAICNSPLVDEDCMYWIEDIQDYVCEDCLNSDCTYDLFSEEYHLNENMYSIYLHLGEDEDGKPIWSNSCIDTYKPEDNYEYNLRFNHLPEYDAEYNTYYVIEDYIKPDYRRSALKWFYF